MLPPIQGPTWGYRHRARLSVHYVAKKGGVLVGFHERKSSFVADMRSCEVLPPAVSRLIVPLREMFTTMALRERLPQVELAVGESRHRPRAAPPRAGGRGGPGEAAGLRRPPRHPVVVPAQGAGDRAPVPPGGRARARLPAARVRARHRLPAHGVHAGERGREPRAREARGGPPRSAARASAWATSSAAWATSRSPSPRAAPPSWAWKGRRRSRRAARRTRAPTGCRTSRASSPTTSTPMRPGALARLGPVDKLLIDPPRDGAMEICKALPDDGRALAHRLRLLQPLDARARRGRAREREGLPAARGGGGQHVPAHGARGEHRGFRPLEQRLREVNLWNTDEHGYNTPMNTDKADARCVRQSAYDCRDSQPQCVHRPQESSVLIRLYPCSSVFQGLPRARGKTKGAAEAAPLSEASEAQSRSPPKMPSSASRFAKMLYRLRYTASVAEM